MENAKASGSPKKPPIQERLEEFARDHPTGVYVITQESEAAELLLLMAAAIRASETEISKPIELVGDSMDQHRKNYNKQQLLYVRQAANKFRRKAANGQAMEFCLEELTSAPLVFHGVTIDFQTTVH